MKQICSWVELHCASFKVTGSRFCYSAGAAKDIDLYIINILRSNCLSSDCFLSIVIFLSFRTDRSGQTVQTQIRLLLEEQSDQGLHCLQFPLHLLDALLEGIAILFSF